MEQYLIGLFQGMSFLTVALLGAGVFLCVVETFVPKIGITGIFGIVLMAMGMSSYYIDGFKPRQVISLLAIVAVVLAIFILIELLLENKGIIKNPDRHKFRTYNSTTALQDLVGNSGKAITNIDLGGTVEINNTLYYAISDSYIAAGSMVQVIGVQNNTLVVKVK